MNEIQIKKAEQANQINNTDAMILEVLSEGRSKRSIIADMTDRHENYVSQRLTRLKEMGLIAQVRDSSMYEITDDGIDVKKSYDDIQSLLAQ